MKITKKKYMTEFYTTTCDCGVTVRARSEKMIRCRYERHLGGHIHLIRMAEKKKAEQLAKKEGVTQ